MDGACSVSNPSPLSSICYQLKLVNHFGHNILALEFVDDQVHLFVQTGPKHNPADVARQFKLYSGKDILERRPKIRESYFWVVDSGK